MLKKKIRIVHTILAPYLSRNSLELVQTVAHRLHPSKSHVSERVLRVVTTLLQ